MQETRHAFREALKDLERQTLGGMDLVLQQLDRALEAVSYQDVELAGMVVADDDRIDGRYLEVHQGILSLLARQAPVAGDLRIVAALLHLSRCIERMGGQCVDIGDDVELREWAMFMILVARCLERIGDNTVDIAEQTVFVVTGLFREFADASTPPETATRG